MAFACLRTFLYILLNFITFCKSEPAKNEEGRPSKDGFKRNLAALSHQQENIVGNGIPEGLKCVEVPWCDSSGVCSRVCQRGSVKLDPWFKWAMQYQLRMSDKLPMCLSQALATHNSGISIADGYGNRDRIYSNYLAWLDVLGGNHKVQTNNQWVSLTDQLNMGVRFIELDVHFVAGELRIAHCGGFHSKPLNRIVSMINVVARMLGRSELAWDTETVGCSPSLSSIPVSDQRLFRDSVSEVADWLAMPENSEEVLMIFLDNQRDLSAWGKVPGMLNQIMESIPQTLILTPPEVLSMRKRHSDTSSTVWESPSVEALRRLGKRVVLLSGSDFGSEMDSLIFSNVTFASLCPYSEAWMRHWQLNPSWDQEDQNLQQSITNLDESFKAVPESAESDMNHGDPSSVDDDDMSSSHGNMIVPGGDNVSGALDKLSRRMLRTSRTEITASFDPQQQAVRLAALAMRDALYADPSLSPDGSDSSSRASSSRRDLHEQATCNSPCCIVGAKVNGTDHDPQHPYEGSRMWRMPACELQYGPLDCGFKLATFNKGAAMVDSHVQQITSCGVNYPAPDLLTPERAAAHIWSWAPGHPAEGTPEQDSRNSTCVYMERHDGRWRTGVCRGSTVAAAAASKQKMQFAACRLRDWRPVPSMIPGVMHRALPGAMPAENQLWRLAPFFLLPDQGLDTSKEGEEAGSISHSTHVDIAPKCPDGYDFSSPHSAFENLVLRQTLWDQGVDKAVLPLYPPLYLPL